MSIQVIGTSTSEEKPLPGNKNRSSENFTFMQVPKSGDITTNFISSASPTSAVLMKDISNGTDEVIASLTSNGTFSADDVNDSDNYYIASPQGTDTHFVVAFMGNV